MAAGMEHVAAVGRLTSDPAAPWVGFAHGPGGCVLVYGSPRGDQDVVQPTDRGELVAVAIAFVTEALPDPPPDLEATHADLGRLLEWLRDTAPDPTSALLLAEAVDAVDDGLAEDVVVHRLMMAAAREAGAAHDQRADAWVGLLLDRYRKISGA